MNRKALFYLKVTFKKEVDCQLQQMTYYETVRLTGLNSKMTQAFKKILLLCALSATISIIAPPLDTDEEKEISDTEFEDIFTHNINTLLQSSQQIGRYFYNLCQFSEDATNPTKNPFSKESAHWYEYTSFLAKGFDAINFYPTAKNIGGPLNQMLWAKKPKKVDPYKQPGLLKSASLATGIISDVSHVSKIWNNPASALYKMLMIAQYGSSIKTQAEALLKEATAKEDSQPVKKETLKQLQELIKIGAISEEKLEEIESHPQTPEEIKIAIKKIKQAIPKQQQKDPDEKSETLTEGQPGGQTYSSAQRRQRVRQTPLSDKEVAYLTERQSGSQTYSSTRRKQRIRQTPLSDEEVAYLRERQSGILT